MSSAATVLDNLNRLGAFNGGSLHLRWGGANPQVSRGDASRRGWRAAAPPHSSPLPSRNRAGEEIQHSGCCWSEAEILNQVELINLEQLLHFLACDTPTPTPTRTAWRSGCSACHMLKC